MDRQIEYYFTLSSPFAYLGHDVFMALMARQAIKVVFRPGQMGRIFEASGGLQLPKRHPVRKAYRLVELQRWREKRNLALNLQPAFFPTDPRLADSCAIAISRSGADPSPFMERAFRALWAFDKNIADTHIVEGLLADAGHDAHAIIDVANSPEVGAAYDENTTAAIAVGVVGSPSYVLAGEVFWGQDRVELLHDALQSGRAPFRSS